VNERLLLAAIALAAVSGLPALLASRTSDHGQRAASLLAITAAACGAAAAISVLARGATISVQLALSPLLPALTFGLDALSAAFLLPVSFLCACASVYDLAYWRQSAHPANGRRLRVCAGLLLAALTAVLAARDGVAFLMAWELMALAAFFLVATEHEHREVQEAGWIYLAATHAGTLLLLLLFCCWERASGGMALVPLAAAGATPAQIDALFVLALVAFGIKAGIVPLHFWLPPAHGSAPSHVSAVMSGVLIKMGVYGVARMLWLLPAPPAWWGVVLLAVGGVSAVLGVAFAIPQHDLKRLLAYHSVENIGIIFLGLGLATLGRAQERGELVVLGLGGALLHVWNHGLFKGLLFLAAGAVLHRTGTREIDRLGGLAKAMPWTAACFLAGAVAICGLPPLNGFVSELLIYLGLFRASHAGSVAAAIAIPALAIAGAMALLCFGKVYGVVFLGTPRTAAARDAREGEPALLVPMLALAACCALLGLLPLLAVPALRPAFAGWLPAPLPELPELAPLALLSAVGGALAFAILLALLWMRRRRTRARAALPTWDCGYLDATSPRVQYTAASFAQPFVHTSSKLLLPRVHGPGVPSLFPGPQRFASHVPDPVLERALLPGLRGLAAACTWLRLLQRGRVQLYLFYVFLTWMLLLLVG
jgi:hydrogenase-4 component B